MEQLRTTLTCAFAGWGPGLGDNDVMGWVTVLVYLASAVSSARAALALQNDRRERRFWWIACAVLLFLALNKQLDLQSLLTMVGRCHASLAGWYEERRAVQRAFVLAVAGGGVVALVLLALLLRGILRRVWAALLGLGFVCGFVVIRAASFHHVDVLIGTSALGVKVNWLLELPGPLLVLAVAMRRRPTKERL
ncbi:MAG TPA: YgjV family protein [Tabrizicola sp.]|nr:YgjV family protein [Tabrizicola sp.]